MRLVVGFFLTLVVVTVGGYSYERIARAQALAEFPPAGELFAVGPTSLHISCLGSAADSPVVLFEVGWGGSSLLWRPIMDALAGDVRVCAYDRRGMVWSEFRTYTDYPRQAAQDLELLLQAAGIHQPLIIAAHSLGGAYARVFAGEFPARVAGLVLIDSVHPDMLSRLEKIDRSSLPFEVRFPVATRWLGEIGLVRLVAQWQLAGALERNPRLESMLRTQAAFAPNHLRGKGFEFNAAPKLHRLSAQYTYPPSMPVVVITQGLRPDPDDEKAVAHFAIWQGMQRDLLKLSSNSRQLIARDSGHNIPVDQPQLIVGAIRDLLASQAQRSSP